MSHESTKPPPSPDNILNPSLSYNGSKTRVEFDGSCLKQDKITFTHEKTVSISIVYEIDKNFPISNYFYKYLALENCLFWAVSLTKNTDIDQYKYSGFGIGFDRKVTFFWVDMSLSVHVDTKIKDILIPDKGPTQGLDDTTLTEEKNATAYQS